MMSQKPDPTKVIQQWPEMIKPFKKPETKKSLWQVANSFGGFILLWGMMFLVFESSYLLMLGLAVLCAGFVVRIFIIQHDCGHGNFFRSRVWRDRLGVLCGVLTLTPYQYWQKTHHLHHATFGNLDIRSEFGDIDFLTVDQYLALPWYRRLNYRLVRNPLILFGLGPIYQFLLKHRFPWIVPKTWKKERRSIYLTNLLLVLLWGGMMYLIGWQKFLLIQIPVSFFAAMFGMWLFYVQHQFEDTYWERQGAWNYALAALRGSSFYVLPKWLQWFTGNIGYHHIHHLCPMIPNYALEDCNDACPDLEAQSRRFTLGESLQTLWVRLWDEDHKHMVGWGYVREYKRKQHLLLRQKLQDLVPKIKEEFLHLRQEIPSKLQRKTTFRQLSSRYQSALMRVETALHRQKTWNKRRFDQHCQELRDILAHARRLLEAKRLRGDT